MIFGDHRGLADNPETNLLDQMQGVMLGTKISVVQQLRTIVRLSIAALRCVLRLALLRIEMVIRAASLPRAHAFEL